MIQLEQRPAPSRAMGVLSPFIALAITVAVGGLIFAGLGKDPGHVLFVFLVEPFESAGNLSELALKSTPLTLCAIGLTLCFRANVWNIGAEGQFLWGAIAGGGLALLATQWRVDVGRWGFFPLLVVAGAAGGAGWAAIVAWLKDRFHANEILVSLMLVYVADLFLKWLVFGPWKDPHGFNFPQTVMFASATEVPRLVRGMRVNAGFLLALLAALGMWLLMFRTYRGMQLVVGGPAPAAARYAGFSSRAAVWTTLLLSGALAGVGGAVEAAGPLGQLTPHVSTGYGFTAIIVAFLGRLHPLGCVLASVVLSVFVRGGELAQEHAGVPAAVSGVFQGVLLFSVLACDTLINFRVSFRTRWRAAR